MKKRTLLSMLIALASGWTLLQEGGGDLGGYPLFDATGIIQDVIDYRQDVYDACNDAWDEYIRQ